MKFITALIISFMFASCTNNHLSDAEKIVGYSLKGKVEFLNKDEKWNDFNGNGYRVEVYKILQSSYFKERYTKEDFKSFDFKNIDNPLNNTDYSEFITNGAGFYKTVWIEDDIETVVIDTVNNKFLYYYSHM